MMKSEKHAGINKVVYFEWLKWTLILLIIALLGCNQTRNESGQDIKPHLDKPAQADNKSLLDDKKKSDFSISALYAIEEKNLLFLGTERHGLWISQDDGKTWKLSENGIIKILEPDDIFKKNMVTDMVEDRKRGVIFLSTMEGVYRSYDYGQKWERFSEGLPYEHHPFLYGTSVYELTIDEKTGDIYAEVGLDGIGIWKSHNEFPAWHSISEGLSSEGLTNGVCFSEKEDAIYIISGIR